MDELFDEAAFGEGAEVLDGGCLAGEAEVFGDLAGGGRHAFALLIIAQIIEDGFLAFGEHGRSDERTFTRTVGKSSLGMLPRGKFVNAMAAEGRGDCFGSSCRD